MARTEVTDYTERPLSKMPLGELRAACQEAYASAQGDEDKAGDVDDAAFYEGNVNALKWVLGLITVDPDNKEGL